jgi:hypothetical protein
MHRQVEILGSGSWLWPVIIIIAVVVVIGIIVYLIDRRKKSSDDSPKVMKRRWRDLLSHLLTEVIELRAANKKLKDTLREYCQDS